MNKRLIGLVGILLLTSCVNYKIIPDVRFYQLQKSESYVKDGYVIEKQEFYRQQRLEDLIKLKTGEKYEH